jgi:hypothetical protein
MKSSYRVQQRCFIETHIFPALSLTPTQFQHITEVVESIDHFVKSTSQSWPSDTLNLLGSFFQGNNNNNKEAFLSHSNIYQRALLPKPTPPCLITPTQRQAAAKLHCLYGVPMLLPKRTHFAPIYPYACSVVYDMRNYTDDNFWGPFLDDGTATVDWERVEAIMLVLGYNLNMFSNDTHGLFRPVWVDPFRGANPGSFAPISLTKGQVPEGPKNTLDPYNITGTWMRVCSLHLIPIRL